MTHSELEQTLQQLRSLTAETEVVEFKEAKTRKLLEQKRGMMQVLLTGRNN